MAWYKRKTGTLLSAVTATGAGTAVNQGPKTADGGLRYFIKATGITSGGTVKIQGSNDNVTWYDLATAAIAATGNTSGQILAPIGQYFRANVTARTDGTYTVEYVLNQNP